MSRRRERKAEQLVANQWWGPFVQSEELRRLGTGKLIEDIVGKIQEKVEANSPMKLCVYSSHDSMIAPLLTSYQLYNNMWPPFSSHIIFELYQSNSPARQILAAGEQAGKGEAVQREEREGGKGAEGHFVRMIYNSEVKRIPECQAEAVEDGTLCPLETFLKISQKLIPRDYKEECRAE